MLATNIDRRQSTQTSKRRKGKHASNAHEETRNTNRRRYKQTRQSADHTATASPTNTRHVTPRSKQSHRSKPITRDQQTEPSHPNTTSMHANRPTKPTTAHAKASNRKGEATECDGNNSRCKARLQKAPNPNTPCKARHAVRQDSNKARIRLLLLVFHDRQGKTATRVKRSANLKRVAALSHCQNRTRTGAIITIFIHTPNSVPRASPSTYSSDCVRCNNSKV
jgi:hypothetical protein